MYRYTTPTIPITIADIDFSDVDMFRIVFANGQTELLFEIDANDSRVDAENNTINIELTQEQTALFSVGLVQIQARILFQSGTVEATQIAKLLVHGVFDEVVI